MRRLKQISRFSLGTAILAALAVVLVRNLNQVDWGHALERPWRIALIVLLCIAELVLQYFVWWRILNRQGRFLSFREGYFLFTISSLSRYLPAGKLWQVVSFLQFGETARIGAASLYAYAVSMMCALLAGALLAAIGTPVLFPSVDSRGATLMALLLAAGSLCLTSERMLHLLARLGGKRLAALAEQRALSIGELFGWTTLHSVSWLIEGVCALFLMRMVDPALPLSTMWVFLTAYAFATFAGYASFLTPAGLGVREGVLVLLLLPHMPVALATFVTLTLRCALTVSDLLFALPLAARLVARRSLKNAGPVDPRSSLRTPTP